MGCLSSCQSHIGIESDKKGARDARAGVATAAQNVGRPPPFETIGKGSREGSGRPVGLNTALRSA
jgi:hypothetical protein